jgi:hypothetical protein
MVFPDMKHRFCAGTGHDGALAGCMVTEVTTRHGRHGAKYRFLLQIFADHDRLPLPAPLACRLLHIFVKTEIGSSNSG